MPLYVGTSGYSYPEWKGQFYPADLPAKQMLRYYGEHFPSVEINSTFRGMPTPAGLKAWAGEVPAGFKFVLKAPELITHRKRLKGADELVDQFLDAAGALKKRLGPVLFQLPPNFKKDLPRLGDFLAQLPRRYRVALEFRHSTWFDDDVFALLKKRRVALCIADADGKMKVPFMATADWGYLRLRRSKYSVTGLKSWARRIREQSWRDAFVFFRHEDEGNGPRFAKRLLELAG